MKKKISPEVSAYFRAMNLKRKNKVGGFSNKEFAKAMSKKGLEVLHAKKAAEADRDEYEASHPR